MSFALRRSHPPWWPSATATREGPAARGCAPAFCDPSSPGICASRKRKIEAFALGVCGGFEPIVRDRALQADLSQRSGEKTQADRVVIGNENVRHASSRQNRWRLWQNGGPWRASSVLPRTAASPRITGAC